MNRPSLSCLLPMLAVGACATLQPNPISDVNPYPATHNVVVDSHGTVKRFYGIPIDLTISRLRSLPYRVKLGKEMGEGDYYTIATIAGDRGVEVKVTFDDNGRLYLAETVSARAVGPRGVKIGSSLAEVKAAWPSGKLLYGREDGLFATYDIGSNVLFLFDPKDMSSEAFDAGIEGVDVSNLTVRKIRLFASQISP